MDDKTILWIAMSVGFAAVWSVGTYWVSSRTGWARHQVDKYLDTLLELMDVKARGRVRDELLEVGQRRYKWGATGGGVAFAIALPAVKLAPSAGYAGMMGVVATVAGTAVGRALGAVLSAPGAAAGDEVRVSALQPHGLTDYMQRREIGVEVALGLLGWGTLVVAVLAWAGVDVGFSKTAAGGVAFAGASLALMSTAALVFQNRLAEAPQRATDPVELIVADVTLAWSLRDLYAAAAGVTGVATLALWYMPDRAWAIVWTFTFVFVTLGLTSQRKTKRPDLAPVAHRLTQGSAA